MKMTHYEIVKRIIGPVDPIGETNTDNERFENLKAMCSLVDSMIGKINAVAINKDSHEMSCKRAADFAERFLDSIIVNS